MKNLFKDISETLDASNKYLAKSWNELIKLLEKDGYKVDSVHKTKPEKWMMAKRNGIIYSVEVTRYHNGDYEVMPYNINKHYIRSEDSNIDVRDVQRVLGDFESMLMELKLKDMSKANKFKQAVVEELMKHINIIKDI